MANGERNGLVSTLPDDKGNILHLDYPMDDPFAFTAKKGERVRHIPTGMVGLFNRGISPLREYEIEMVLDDDSRITVWHCHVVPEHRR